MGYCVEYGGKYFLLCLLWRDGQLKLHILETIHKELLYCSINEAENCPLSVRETYYHNVTIRAEQLQLIHTVALPPMLPYGLAIQGCQFWWGPPTRIKQCHSNLEVRC